MQSGGRGGGGVCFRCINWDDWDAGRKRWIDQTANLPRSISRCKFENLSSANACERAFSTCAPRRLAVAETAPDLPAGHRKATHAASRYRKLSNRARTQCSWCLTPASQYPGIVTLILLCPSAVLALACEEFRPEATAETSRPRFGSNGYRERSWAEIIVIARAARSPLGQ